MKLYGDALAIAPTDGTSEALEYGLEIARQDLDWFEDINCGLDVDSDTAEFSCSKRFNCPLKSVVSVSV